MYLPTQLHPWAAAASMYTLALECTLAKLVAAVEAGAAVAAAMRQEAMIVKRMVKVGGGLYEVSCWCCW